MKSDDTVGNRDMEHVDQSHIEIDAYILHCNCYLLEKMFFLVKKLH